MVWGCDANNPLPPHKRTVYRLGLMETTRCPLATLREPVVQHAISLFGPYKNGSTPNGHLRAETSAYREFMSLLESLSEEASSWYQQELESRNAKKDRVIPHGN